MPPNSCQKRLKKHSAAPGNFEKAKELLKEAGYSLENPAIIEIWYPANSTKKQLTASTLKAYVEQKLEGLMELELNSVEAATAYENLDKGMLYYPDVFRFYESLNDETSSHRDRYYSSNTNIIVNVYLYY